MGSKGAADSEGLKVWESEQCPLGYPGEAEAPGAKVIGRKVLGRAQGLYPGASVNSK